MDKEEKELSAAYHAGKIPLEAPSRELLDRLALAGENTFKKDKLINLRLSSHDLDGIQRKAAQQGIPYQTFISGIIHQYVEGDLQEKPRIHEAG